MHRRITMTLLAILAASCGGGGDDSTGPHTNNSAQLRGVVHEIPTGPPIADATVSVQGKQALSASDGSFSLSELVAGETTVVLTKTGYTAQNLRLTLQRGDNFFSLGMARSSAVIPHASSR